MFRPSAHVTDPHGREWEIYASKLTLPRRGAPDPTPSGLSIPSPRAEAITAPIDGIVYLLSFISRLLLLAQVEGGLARGETPRPRNAQFVRSV